MTIIFQIFSKLNYRIEVFINYFNFSCYISLVLLYNLKSWINFRKPVLYLRLEFFTLKFIHKYLSIKIVFEFLLNFFNYFFGFIRRVLFSTKNKFKIFKFLNNELMKNFEIINDQLILSINIFKSA
jgi:hypothetical protein